MSLTGIKRAGAIGTIALAATFMTACSSYSKINADLFDSIDQIETSISGLQTGMTLDQVSSSLGVNEKYFYKLNRSDLQTARLGAEARINLDSPRVDEVAADLSRLEGYQISYQDIKKSWSFTDFGARIEKSKQGEEMNVVFIFRDGQLEEVIDSGGLVNEYDKESIIPEPKRLLEIRP